MADTCEVFADGDWIESKDQSPEGIRLVQTGNIGEGVFKDRGDKARYISEATLKRLRCTEVFEGDCLVSRLPDPVGRSCLLPDTGERMITAVDCTIVRFDPKQTLPRFFSFYSQSLDYLEAVEAETTGTTRKRISRSRLGQVAIPAPPLPEQQRIVRILDEAFEGVATAKANAEKNLRNARAIFESHLQSVFTQHEGWLERRLGEIGKTQYGLSEPMNEQRRGYRIFRMGELQDGRLLDTGRMKFADITRAEFEKYRLRPGDVLFNRTNSFELVGKTGIFELGGDYCFASYLVRVLINTDIMLPEFLNYFMNSEGFQDSVKRKASKSINQANINATILSNEPVCFPESLQEQKTIVRRLDTLRAETHRLESLYQQKLAALEELRKSLLNQAFGGEL